MTNHIQLLFFTKILLKMTQKISQIGQQQFNNIYYLCENYTGSKTIFQFQQLKEYPYYSQILINLYHLLNPEFNNYNFFIYSKIAQKKLVPDSDLLNQFINNKTILFFISDETGIIPLELAKKVKLIFKVLLKEDSIENIHYFPLGYANGTQNKVIPINERGFNVFFIGQLGRSRIDLYKHLAKKNFINDNILLLLKKYIKKDLSNLFEDSFIKFTTNFGEGLNIDQYNQMLNNSKIVICPYGAVTEETFRHYEAMRAGCVVVTLKMPDIFVYKNSPIIQIDNWRDLEGTIKKLLKNPGLMEDIHYKTLSWWKEKCSEKSVAKYLYEKILEAK